MLIITTLALLLAATMGWMAFRLLRDEQRRSEARVAALSAALDDTSPHAYVASAETLAARRDVPRDDTRRDEASFDQASRPMFGAATPDVEIAPRDDHRALALAAAVLVCLGIAGVWWSTSDVGSGAPPAPAAAVTAAPTGGVPMDLMALGHERADDGLVIRGLVRNPSAASTRTSTVASVFLFDEAGGFLGSGRSALDTPALTPGAEASFAVTLPDNPRVRRYRVTFRAADGTVVPHVDKRRGPA